MRSRRDDEERGVDPVVLDDLGSWEVPEGAHIISGDPTAKVYSPDGLHILDDPELDKKWQELRRRSAPAIGRIATKRRHGRKR